MRKIDWDAPLTKEDKAWLSQRLTPELEVKMAENQARLAKKSGGESTDKNTGDGFTDDYDKWKIDELKAEAEGREPAIELAGVTKKQDLIAVLRTWDKAHPDAVEV
jgi:hypothetical protein